MRFYTVTTIKRFLLPKGFKFRKNHPYSNHTISNKESLLRFLGAGIIYQVTKRRRTRLPMTSDKSESGTTLCQGSPAFAAECACFDTIQPTVLIPEGAHQEPKNVVVPFELNVDLTLGCFFAIFGNGRDRCGSAENTHASECHFSVFLDAQEPRI